MRTARSRSFLPLWLILSLIPSAAGRAGAQEAPERTPRPGGAPPAARSAPLPAQPRTPRAAPEKSTMFQIALVLADSEPAKAQAPPLPKGLQKALTDIQDFLPFKSYRLYDSTLVRASGEGKARLKGPDGDEYTAAFFYQDDGDAHGGILIDQFSLTRTTAAAAFGKRLEPGVAPMAPESPEPPQVSSFRIRRGETVVVGSSGLSGGKSLIVVLTALP